MDELYHASQLRLICVLTDCGKVLQSELSMKQEDLWKSVQEDLRIEFSGGTFGAFIAQSNIVDISESDGHLNATVAAFSPWHQRMIRERYQTQIKEAFERVAGKPCDITFTANKGQPGKMPANSPAFGPLFTQAEEERASYARATQAAHLRTDFTFEQFAVSTTNEMAYAAAQAVSRNPGQTYHLLFLFGGVGVGKTHLMQAIGHRILEKDPDTRILYCTGEQFTNQIVEAIQHKSTQDFRKRYRSVKALLIDDIQFIGGKDKVQEEFFHTFNAIHQEGGQIVLTSDQLPTEIIGLEDRLRSRFEGGLTIDIQQPSFELRAAILLNKAIAWGVELPMDAAQLIAANVESTRFLEGFLRRVIAESAAKNEPITVETTKRLLGSMKNKGGTVEPEKRVVTDPQDIFVAISDVFSLKIAQLKGKRRKQDIVAPRHLAMYLLRNDARLSFEQVGDLFGGRDHTTVMHAVEKMTAQLPNDEHLRGALNEVRKRMKTAVAPEEEGDGG